MRNIIFSSIMTWIIATSMSIVLAQSIDISSLIPKYVPDDEVTLISAGEDAVGTPCTPDWASSLIMMEVRIETATPEGNFKSAVRVLDHCAEMGVNGIWLCPIYENGTSGPASNHYGNFGLHRVEPALVGTSDTNEGWLAVKNFVDEAHVRNVRVLLDIITWGTATASPLFKEHPDWFKGKAWGNEAFHWDNEEFREWFIARAVENIIVTGADGYRADCEPNYAGYEVFTEIRNRLLAKGRKVLIIAEDGCLHGGAFDFEQDGVLDYKDWHRGMQYEHPKNFYLDELNIVDSVKEGTGIGSPAQQKTASGGKYRLYTYCVSNHDYQYSAVNGNRLNMGYQAILAPFIPLWYLGEEFGFRNNGAVFYFQPVDWSLRDDPKNQSFFEDIKKYIRIRRMFPEIFTCSPDNHRNSNLCKVTAEGQPLQVYARYAGNKAVIVVGNNGRILSEPGELNRFTVSIPFDEMGLGAYKTFTLIDLMTGKEMASGSKSELNTFTATVEYQHIGVYLLSSFQ